MGGVCCGESNTTLLSEIKLPSPSNTTSTKPGHDRAKSGGNLVAETPASAGRTFTYGGGALARALTAKGGIALIGTGGSNAGTTTIGGLGPLTDRRRSSTVPGDHGSNTTRYHTTVERAIAALRAGTTLFAMANVQLTSSDIVTLGKTLSVTKKLTEIDMDGVEAVTGGNTGVAHHGLGAAGGAVGLRPLLRGVGNNETLNQSLVRVRFDNARTYIFDDLVSALQNKMSIYSLSLRGLDTNASHAPRLLAKPFGASLRKLDLTGNNLFERQDMIALEKALSHNPATMATPPYSRLQELSLPVRLQTGIYAARLLHACPYLAVLELRGTDISALTLCVRGLHSSPARHLTHLTLSFEHERIQDVNEASLRQFGSQTRARQNDDLSAALCTLLRSHHIHLISIDVTELGAGVDADFFQAMYAHRTLTNIAISDSMIFDSLALEILNETIEARSALESVALSCTPIVKAKLQTDLVRAITNHQTLRVLTLFRVDLTDETCTYLAQHVLPHTPVLEELNLRWNRIGDIGCASLADALSPGYQCPKAPPQPANTTRERGSGSVTARESSRNSNKPNLTAAAQAGMIMPHSTLAHHHHPHAHTTNTGAGGTHINHKTTNGSELPGAVTANGNGNGNGNSGGVSGGSDHTTTTHSHTHNHNNTHTTHNHNHTHNHQQARSGSTTTTTTTTTLSGGTATTNSAAPSPKLAREGTTAAATAGGGGGTGTNSAGNTGTRTSLVPSATTTTTTTGSGGGAAGAAVGSGGSGSSLPYSHLLCLRLNDNRDITIKGFEVLSRMLTVNQRLIELDVRDTSCTAPEPWIPAILANNTLRTLLLSTPEANASIAHPPPDPKPLSTEFKAAFVTNRSLTRFECESLRDEHLPFTDAITLKNWNVHTRLALNWMRVGLEIAYARANPNAPATYGAIAPMIMASIFNYYRETAPP